VSVREAATAMESALLTAHADAALGGSAQHAPIRSALLPSCLPPPPPPSAPCHPNSTRPPQPHTRYPMSDVVPTAGAACRASPVSVTTDGVALGAQSELAHPTAMGEALAWTAHVCASPTTVGWHARQGVAARVRAMGTAAARRWEAHVHVILAGRGLIVSTPHALVRLSRVRAYRLPLAMAVGSASAATASVMLSPAALSPPATLDRTPTQPGARAPAATTLNQVGELLVRDAAQTSNACMPVTSTAAVMSFEACAIAS